MSMRPLHLLALKRRTTLLRLERLLGRVLLVAERVVLAVGSKEVIEVTERRGVAIGEGCAERERSARLKEGRATIVHWWW